VPDAVWREREGGREGGRGERRESGKKRDIVVGGMKSGKVGRKGVRKTVWDGCEKEHGR
jgi:hypothetical protein